MSRLLRFARAVVIGAGIGAVCVWRFATEFRGRNDGAMLASNADPDAEWDAIMAATDARLRAEVPWSEMDRAWLRLHGYEASA